MKNFLRAVRCAWPYRGRLIVSILCALCAAVLWSLNFTAITPVLTILMEKQSLQQWVDRKITDSQKSIEGWQVEVDGLTKKEQLLEQEPASGSVDQQKRDL